jgi:hypothetical protein
MEVRRQWVLDWLGRYTMAWGIQDIIKQKLAVQNRDVKNIQMAFVMLCYVMFGRWAIHTWERFIRRALLLGEYNT